MKTEMLSQLFTNLIAVWGTVYPHDTAVKMFDQNPDGFTDTKTRENYVAYFIESLANNVLPPPYKEIFDTAVLVWEEYKNFDKPKEDPVPPIAPVAPAPEVGTMNNSGAVPQVAASPHDQLIINVMNLIHDFYSANK